jgi:hypothetical protein
LKYPTSQANVIQRAAAGPAREAALHTQMQEMIEMMRASHNNNNNNHRNRTPSNYRGRGRAAILDSGTTGTFVTSHDSRHLVNPTKIDDGPIALAASGTPMVSITRGRLPLSPHLSTAAEEAFELDSLTTGSLVSLAKICDDDCIALFTKHDVKILKRDQVIITGKRMSNGLWSVPIGDPAPHQINGILRTDQVRGELATYHHGTMGGPAPSTLLRVIRKGYLSTFPGLTTKLISKHIDKSENTVLGHQDQEAKTFGPPGPRNPQRL